MTRPTPITSSTTGTSQSRTRRRPLYLDLNRQYAFYAGYHRNHVNQLIHVICIPIIVISTQMLLSFLTVPVFGDAAACITLFYAVYYFLLDRQVGLAALPLVLSYCISAKILLRLCETKKSIIFVAGVMQFFGWTSQLYGHAIHEKNSPALTESIVQSFLVAPLFVVLEPLLHLGYFPKLNENLSQGDSRRIVDNKGENTRC